MTDRMWKSGLGSMGNEFAPVGLRYIIRGFIAEAT